MGNHRGSISSDKTSWAACRTPAMPSTPTHTDRSWHRFLVFNALGGAVWASAWAARAYAFGSRVQSLPEAARYAAAGLVIVTVVAGGMLVKGRWRRLEGAAELEYPGELTCPRTAARPALENPGRYRRRSG